VSNKKEFREELISEPASDRYLSSAFLFVGSVFLLVLCFAGVLFLQHAIFSFGLFILSLLFFFLWLSQRRRSRSGKERFKALLEFAPDPFCITDSEGRTRFTNSAFLEWCGLSRSSLIGRNVLEQMVFTTDTGSKVRVWPSVQPLLLSGEQWKGEVEYSMPDGQPAIAELLLSPMIDSNGKLVECMALHKDLAEKKEFTRKIVETQRQFSSIVESSLDAIMIVQDEKIVYVNPSAVHLFDYATREEMQKLKLVDTIAPQSKPFMSMNPDGRGVGEEVFRNYELRGLTKHGKIIDIEANAHVILWNGHTAVQSSFRNITERKMLERDQMLWLWEQETLSDIDRKLVGVVDLNKIFSAIVQQTLNLTRANFGGILLYDDAHGQMQWNSICGNSLQHAMDIFTPSETLRALMNHTEPVVIQSAASDAPYPISQLSIVSEEKLVSMVWLPLTVEGKKKGVFVVGYRQYHDFTGREMRLLTSLAEKNSLAMVNGQLYTDLLQREKELELLSNALVQAQEDERRRIAREIHDGLGQMLTAIKFNLEILEDMITAGKDERERIDDMKNLLDSVMKEAREISYNLMPSVLEDFGLTPALQLLGEQFSNRTNVKMQFHAHGITERLDSNLEIALYRIAQEALNNVSKHANATQVDMQIIRHGDRIRLMIEDNGKGIGTQQSHLRATGTGGMGLPGMRERAASLGGTLIIDSGSNSGTLIVVEVPRSTAHSHG
jgi:PAS domain S-box-containing protein